MFLGTADQRLDDALHPRFAQLVGQLVQMHGPFQNELLLSFQDVGNFDRMAPVQPLFALEAGLLAERVHQPRLALRPSPDQFQGIRAKRLAGFRRVLGQQGLALRGREIAQPERFGLDVERAAAPDLLVPGGRPNAVIPHVAHAAEHDALQECARTEVVAIAELAEHGEQRVAHQRIDLVDQQNERPCVRLRPLGKDLCEGRMGPFGLQCATPSLGNEIVLDGPARP